MKCLILFAILSRPCCAAGQTDFTGVYQGLLNGDPAKVNLEQHGNKVTGLYQETQNNYDILGAVLNDQFQGKIILQNNQVVLGTLMANLIQNGIHMEITVLGVTKVSVDFFKIKENTDSIVTSNPGSTTYIPQDNYSRDLNVVGNWIKEEIINSGIGENAAGFTIAYYLSFKKDGTFVQEKAGSAGGSNWSGGSKRNPDVTGQWYTKDQILYIKSQGQNEYIILNQYLFHEGNLVFKTPEGKYLIWNKN